MVSLLKNEVLGVNQEVDPTLKESIVGKPKGTAAPKEVAQFRATMGSLIIEGKLPEQKVEAEGPEVDVNYEAVKQVAQQDKLADLQRQMEGVAFDPTMPAGDKIARISELNVEAGKPVKGQDAFVHLLSEEALAAATPEERNAQQYLSEMAENIAFSRRQRDRALAVTTDLPPLEEVFDDFAAAAIVPGSFGIPILSVIEQALPEVEIEPSDYLLVGDLIRRAKNHIRSLPIEEQTEVLKRIGHTINDGEYYLGSNDFTKFEIRSVFEDLSEDSLSDEILNDVFSLLDVLGFAGLLRSGIKLPGKIAKSLDKALTAPRPVDEVVENFPQRQPENTPMGIIDQVDPKRSKELSEAAVVSEDVAEQLGTTREIRTAETMAPADIRDGIRKKVSLVDDDDFNTLLFSDTEIAEQLNKVNKLMTDPHVESLSGRVYANNIYLDTTESGFKASYVSTKTATHGYGTLDEARAIQAGYKKMLNDADIQGVSPEILIKAKDSDEYVPISNYTDLRGVRNGDYAVRIDIDDIFHSGHARKDFDFIDDDITHAALNFRVADFFDKSAWGSRILDYTTNVAVDLTSRRLKNLKRVIEPLNKLPSSSQRKVYEVLDRGDQEMKWYSPSELRSFWGNEKDFKGLVEGYYSAVEHQQRAYRIMNSAVYKILRGRGSRLIRYSVNGENRNFLGKPLRPQDTPDAKELRAVYDADLGGLREITLDELSKLREGTSINQMVRLDFPLRFDGQEVSFIVGKKAGKGLKVEALPSTVLRSQAGYIPRMYQAGYLVRKRYTTTADGFENQERWSVVGIEKDIASARQLLDEFNAKAAAEGTKAKYEVVRSSEFTDKSGQMYYDLLNLDFLADTGQLFTSVRRDAELLGKMDPVTGKSRRILQSVPEAMNAFAHRASRAGTYDLLIEKYTTNWLKKYGQFSYQGKFPMFGDPLPFTSDRQAVGQSLEYARAKASARFIQRLAGVEPEGMARFAKQHIVDTIEDAYLNRANKWTAFLAENVQNFRDLNIISKVKTLAFFQLITQRIVRQAVLQANQMSIYLGRKDAFKYFFTEGGTRDFAAMWMALASKSAKLDDKGMETFGRLAGKSGKELAEDVEAYMRSGLPDSVDSHLWVAADAIDRNSLSLTEAASELGDALHYGKVKGRQIEKTLRRYGFDLGEQTQLLAAFLTEKNAWQKLNPKKAHLWKDPLNLQQIAGRARSMSLNMNQAGATALQKGLLSLPFQFMSHTTKSLQLMAPSHIGRFRIPGLSNIANRHISNREKFNIFVAQSLMYGTGGLGMTKGWDLIKENFFDDPSQIPPELDLIVEEALFGTAFNMMMNLADGKDVTDFSENYEVTESLSPLGGSLFWNVRNPATHLYDFFMGNQRSLWDFAGPGAQVLKRMGGALPTIGHIYADATYLNTSEKITASFKELIGRSFFAYDDYQRMRFEQALQRHVSRNGVIGAEGSDLEFLTKFLLSVQTERSKEVADLDRDVRHKIKILDDPVVSLNQLGADAKTDFNNMLRVLQLLEKGDISASEFQDTVRLQGEGRYLTYSDRELQIYQYEMAKLTQNSVIVNPDKSIENVLVRRLAKAFPMMADDPMEELYKRILAMPNFDRKEELVDAMRQVYF